MRRYIKTNELYHYGVKGMRWGVRKARKSNAKVDKSFKLWKENSEKREDAITLGKQANSSRMAYERDSSNKALKKAYKSDQRNYKKSLKDNTTYRKGQIRREVGRDMANRYLKESRQIKKQLDKDPENKKLQKDYKYLSDQHQYERAKARKAPEVAAKRSAKIASMKSTMTKTAKGVATAAAITAGTVAVNKVLQSHNVQINGKSVRLAEASVHDAVSFMNAGMKFMKYFY